jgi:hypothetical protein
MKLHIHKSTSSFLSLQLIFEVSRMFYVLLRERACHVHTLESFYAFFLNMHSRSDSDREIRYNNLDFESSLYD